MNYLVADLIQYFYVIFGDMHFHINPPTYAYPYDLDRVNLHQIIVDRWHKLHIMVYLIFDEDVCLKIQTFSEL